MVRASLNDVCDDVEAPEVPQVVRRITHGVELKPTDLLRIQIPLVVAELEAILKLTCEIEKAARKLIEGRPDSGDRSILNCRMEMFGSVRHIFALLGNVGEDWDKPKFFDFNSLSNEPYEIQALKDLRDLFPLSIGDHFNLWFGSFVTFGTNELHAASPIHAQSGDMCSDETPFLVADHRVIEPIRKKLALILGRLKPTQASDSATEKPKDPTPTPPVDPLPPQLVSLLQMGDMVHRNKRTIETLKKKLFPPPTVKGAAGQIDLWDWNIVRPILEKQYNRQFPALFIGDKFIEERVSILGRQSQQ
jgi:hypothetical protein